MSRIIYHSGIELVESYIITYRIYVLKNPFTNEVFYVGKTMKELKERLSGHMSSLNSNGNNNEKNEYVKNIIDKGERPIIEEVEVINGTCFVHGLYASYREFHWMNHYKEKGITLLNHVGVKTDAVCFQYEQYVAGVKEGKTSYSYYYCGQTKHGLKVYDGEKMDEDGFLFEREIDPEDHGQPPRPDPTYHQIYDDENPNYIKMSFEEE